MEKQKTPLFISLIPVLVLITLLSINVWLFGDNTTSGSNQLSLLIAGAVAAIIGGFYGVSWKSMLEGAVKVFPLQWCFNNLIINRFIGWYLDVEWYCSSMIYYGLEILNPTIFLFATCVVCAVVSLATGSSWSTIATIGIAMLGIGGALGLSQGLIGGAIISGAYFGDKMSPLSDTTNLALAMAGTDLISHIKYMMYTTIPSMTITLIIFLVIGLNINEGDVGFDQVSVMQNALSSTYNISLWSLLIPVLVIVLIIKRYLLYQLCLLVQ